MFYFIAHCSVQQTSWPLLNEKKVKQFHQHHSNEYGWKFTALKWHCVLISTIHQTVSSDNKVQTCFRAQSGWTSCLSSLLQIVVSSGSLALSLSSSTSAHVITASAITEELLVCIEPQGPGSSPSSQSLPSVLPKNTEQIKAGDWSVSARLWERRRHRN